jgi:hypothetical protein
VAEGEAMVTIAHVVLFVDSHSVSVFWTRHKTPAPMEKELVMVRTYCSCQRGRAHMASDSHEMMFWD